MKRQLALGLTLAMHLTGAIAIELPKTVEEARAAEREVALPSTGLYTRSYELKNSKPGELLAQEPFAGYQIGGLGRAVRIAYRSEDVTGRAVATTAMVLLPAGKAPAGGWPLVAWGHGTSGVSSACAPSLMKDGYYGTEGLSDMLKAGLAVVATDYYGLGTPGPHLYINKPSQARDVIYSVPAAQKAVPELGKRWVSDGHSQGGLASWGVAEMEAGLSDESYLGSVSVSGAGSLEGLFQYLLDHPAMSLYLPFAAAGIQARFADFKPANILSPALMDHYKAATTEGCWNLGYVLYKDTPANSALKPNWRDDPSVKHFVEENTLGSVKVSKPLLVITGEGDQTVPIAGVRKTVKQSCAAGSRLAFHSYAGLDHDETMIESVKLQISWMKDRFAGHPFKASCEEEKGG